MWHIRFTYGCVYLINKIKFDIMHIIQYPVHAVSTNIHTLEWIDSRRYPQHESTVKGT